MTKTSSKELLINPEKKTKPSKQYQRDSLNRDLKIRGNKQLSLKVGTPLIQTTFN